MCCPNVLPCSCRILSSPYSSRRGPPWKTFFRCGPRSVRVLCYRCAYTHLGTCSKLHACIVTLEVTN